MYAALTPVNATGPRQAALAHRGPSLSWGRQRVGQLIAFSIASSAASSGVMPLSYRSR